MCYVQVAEKNHTFFPSRDAAAGVSPGLLLQKLSPAAFHFLAPTEQFMQAEKTVSAALLWILLGLVIAIAAWDIWVVTARPQGTTTVSDQLEYLTYRYPILAFVAGLMIGHVFHRSGDGH